jgi:hypothetical protein
VALLVFVHDAGLELHREGVTFHLRNSAKRSAASFHAAGS